MGEICHPNTRVRGRRRTMRGSWPGCAFTASHSHFQRCRFLSVVGNHYDRTTGRCVKFWATPDGTQAWWSSVPSMLSPMRQKDQPAHGFPRSGQFTQTTDLLKHLKGYILSVERFQRAADPYRTVELARCAPALIEWSAE
jgi:hypothetical protein